MEMSTSGIKSFQINKSQQTAEFDKGFFHQAQGAAYIKGKTNLMHIRGLTRGPTVVSNSSGSTQSINSVHLMEKPWRHQKKEKREKLRKKFAHLDEH